MDASIGSPSSRRHGAPARLGSGLALAAVLALVTACGGDDGGDSRGGSATPTPGAGGDAASEPVEKKTVDPATAGSIVGVVDFSGTPPTDTLTTTADPWCAGHTGGEIPDNAVLVHDGKLENVVVWIAEGLEDYEFPRVETPVVLDQRGCAYEPRVLALQVRQPLEIRNSDGTLHNVNIRASENKRKNLGMPQDTPAQTVEFRKPEMAVPLQCDVHPWMGAAVAVVEHPCFDVTASDGSFTIEGVPPGDYVVEAWHERLGTVRVEVTVGEGAQVTAPALTMGG